MRKNTVTWSDCNYMTRKCHSLVEAMMQYQMYSLNGGVGNFGGDESVIIAAIELRSLLNKVIERNLN